MIHLCGDCVDSQFGDVWQVHISGSIQCTSLPEVESCCSVLDSFIVMIHEIECFWFVKIWLAYPFLWLYCVWFFYLWWSCLDTGADGAADGSLGDHLGWRMLLGIVHYFKKKTYIWYFKYILKFQFSFIM